MEYTFIDICSGIGGCRLALEYIGLNSVGFSEIEPKAIKIYKKNFNTSKEAEIGNILDCDISKIPNADILIGGFPCQPFSNIGKKLGEKDPRNNVFEKILNIVESKDYKFVFLENVYSLLKNDIVLSKIKEAFLRKGLKFNILKMFSFEHGVPQNRKRILIVGSRDEIDTNIKKEELRQTMSDILEGCCTKKIGFTLRTGGMGSKYGDKRNWEYYLVNGNIVRINLSQAKKLQGFPDWFSFEELSERQSIKLLGNSVTVPVLHKFIKHILKNRNIKI